jgi:hypothetical protein
MGKSCLLLLLLLLLLGLYSTIFLPLPGNP